MRSLKELERRDIHGLTCLLRTDFNVESLRETFRLESTLPTVRWLSERLTKVVILSHRGRPEKPNQEESLRLVVPFLKRHLNMPAVFFKKFNLSEIKRKIAAIRKPAVFLLENLRFEKGEGADDPVFAKQLASLGDFFINEAFAVSHRRNASVSTLPKLLPAYAGFRLAEEIENLSRVMRKPKKPLVVILGGAKVFDKAGVIKHFIRRANAFLIGGITANTFLKAKGMDIGNSRYEPKMVPTAGRLLASPKIFLPSDFRSDRGKILDIGPLSIKKFKSAIKAARTIIWSGPMGFFEDPKFRAGTEMLLQAVADSGAFSVVGGGETTQLIYERGLASRFSFVSTGGGAMLEFLAGKKLPGIEVLKHAKSL